MAFERTGAAGRWAAVIVVVLVVGAGVGFLQTRDDRPSVLLVGDSITAISERLVTDELHGDYRVLTSGAPKRRADERVHDLPLLVATKPDAVVVNLGTNDVIQHTDLAATAKAIEKIGGAFPTERCVILVTVNQNMYSASDARLGPDAVAVNRLIVALAARRGWTLVRWDEIVHRYIAEGEPNGHLSVDTIHPRPIGQKLLADAYRRALKPCLAAK